MIFKHLTATVCGARAAKWSQHRNSLTAVSLLLFGLLTCNVTHAAGPIYADGDLAPLGAPDGVINLGDYLIAQSIVLGTTAPTPLQLAHGDVYPQTAPDGEITIQDVLSLQNRLLSGSQAYSYVATLTLFINGPATVSAAIDPSATTNITVNDYNEQGATIVSNPYAEDPDESGNTVWNIAVSGGTANAYLSTANLTSDPVFDSGFDFSGMSQGQLVFDIRVNSLDAGTQLTVKMDSGYPALGQKVLTSAQSAPGDWRRVAISFAELLANPGPGSGLDLSNVNNAFVIEVTGGSADFDLDNIFISNACLDPDQCSAGVKLQPEPTVYSLVWNDEFEGSVLSSDKWLPEIGYGNFGWGNNEWQRYTDAPDNLSVEDGNLVISARCDSAPNCGARNGTVTSARINTLGKFAFKYGKVEARLKPPVGKGMWPAFWMLGANFSQVGWPQTGEIDIMEMHYRYSNERTTHFTLHYCDDYRSANPCQYDPGWNFISQSLTFPYSLGDDYQVFSAEWDEDGITGKINGQPYYYLNIDPYSMDEFLKEFFIILNVAVGGTLGGEPDSTTTWPQTMLVDYVRVYQAEGGEGTYTTGTGPVGPTLGVYSETHTDTLLGYTNIINGADFGGNLTNTNENSSAVSPADGSAVLAVDYLNTGKFYGGFIFNFAYGRDLAAYQSLKFAINASDMPGFNDMVIQLENPGGGQPAPRVYLADYAPASTNGDWVYYDIPLADFLGQTVSLALDNIVYLGFWNPRSANSQLNFGTLYFDDIHFGGGPQ